MAQLELHLAASERPNIISILFLKFYNYKIFFEIFSEAASSSIACRCLGLVYNIKFDLGQLVLDMYGFFQILEVFHLQTFEQL